MRSILGPLSVLWTPGASLKNRIPEVAHCSPLRVTLHKPVHVGTVDDGLRAGTVLTGLPRPRAGEGSPL